MVLLTFFSVNTNASSKAVTIGISLSLTGKYAEMGNMQQKGIKLWEQNINKKGGLLNRKVKIIIEDDQSSPDRAFDIYKTHIEHNKVDLVIGPYSSSISEAILPIIEKHKQPILLSGASADRLWEKGYQYAFGVYTPASKYTVGFLQMMLKNKFNQVAIVAADDAFSVSLSENTAKWAKRFTLNVPYSKTFKKGQKNLDHIVKELKVISPDVVIVCGHMNESVNMVRAMKKAAWYPKAYYASVGPAMNKYKTILNNDANLSFSSSQWEIEGSSRYPFGQEFVKLFEDNYKEKPSYHAATAYSAGMILEIAVKETQSLDTEMLRETYLKLDTLTLIGRFGVNKQGKQRRHFPLIVQWQDGKKEVVWPEEIKTADPIFR